MKRIALGIEYFGQGYHGWQAQQGLPTIQGMLEDALSKVANETIHVQCAGRTDASVHATGQVVHFDTNAKRHVDAWIWGVNAHLPPAIAVRWANHVDYHFHARFKALSRRYCYIIFNHPIRPAILNGRTAWHYYPLDASRMHEAAQLFLGERDFSSFRSSQCNSKTPMRNMIECNIRREGDFIIMDVEANAFLHHMVRNIAGTLMKVGSGFKEVNWINEVLEAKSRRVAGETAPAEGLYLTEVKYPSPYTFPLTNGPILL